MKIKRRLKTVASASLSALLRGAMPLFDGLERLYAHASLAAALRHRLPASVIVLRRVSVYGSGHIKVGEDVLLYPDLHLETQDDARIVIGESVVISRGVHIVAMAGVSIGDGCMIGEYTSIRDANHARHPNRQIRDAGYNAKPIVIGREVWLGRGVTVLAGVTIGDGATVGANAVVTRDVPEGATVGGIPAAPLAASQRSAALQSQP